MTLTCPFCGARGKHRIVRGGINGRILAHNGLVLLARLFYPVVHVVSGPTPDLRLIHLCRVCRACGRRFLPDQDAEYVATCWHCGYNLTGNISGVCPECGQPIPTDPDSKPEGADR